MATNVEFQTITISGFNKDMYTQSAQAEFASDVNRAEAAIARIRFENDEARETKILTVGIRNITSYGNTVTVEGELRFQASGSDDRLKSGSLDVLVVADTV